MAYGDYPVGTKYWQSRVMPPLDTAAHQRRLLRHWHEFLDETRADELSEFNRDLRGLFEALRFVDHGEGI